MEEEEGGDLLGGMEQSNNCHTRHWATRYRVLRVPLVIFVLMSTEASSLELTTKPAADIENLGSDEPGVASPSHQLGSGGEIFKDFTLFEKRIPQDFTWSGVNFKVGSKQILSDCWGNVPSGKVCAIMGSSGAGKSSLLNVLAGRSATAGDIQIDAEVMVGCNKIDPVAFRKNIAYVMQDDSLLSTTTPREALLFSAALRTPTAATIEELNKLVNQVLAALSLEDCADTLVGNAMIKGISGGQRKRTSVGVEIITNPSLLFLDEPTSGLDSYTAYNLVKLLRKIAQGNCAVLCTIHQPSSEVFHLFDKAIFMKQGRILYQGSPSFVVEHFSKGGFDCPTNYNPSDFVMYVSQTETTETLEKRGLFMSEMDAVSRERCPSAAHDEYEVEIKAPVHKQLYWLLAREFTHTVRNKPALIARFGVTIILNIIFGLIFLDAGDKNDANPDNFSAHFGALTMVTISSMFGTANPTMMEFPSERPMFMREYSTGTYNSPAYFISKACFEFPLAFLQALVQYIIVYFMVGFQGNFILLVLAAWGTGIASSSLAVILSCLVHDAKQASELGPLLFVPQILFAGFFIRTSQIPVWLRWAQYLCSLKYGINLVALNEFSSEYCNDKGTGKCEDLFERNNMEPNHWWVYVIVLAALTIGFRTIACMILSKKAKRFY